MAVLPLTQVAKADLQDLGNKALHHQVVSADLLLARPILVNIRPSSLLMVDISNTRVVEAMVLVVIS